jgi:hypothetical protein
MKSHCLIWLIVCLLLSSCEGPPQPHQVVFDEAAFAGTQAPGNGSVVGQGWIEMKDHRLRYVQNTSMDLVPVTAYSTEIIERYFLNDVKLTKADPRYAKYVRRVSTDATGHFSFHSVPPGEYYLATSVDWKDSDTDVDSDGVVSTIWTQYIQPICARVTLKSGQTQRVTEWSCGKPSMIR